MNSESCRLPDKRLGGFFCQGGASWRREMAVQKWPSRNGRAMAGWEGILWQGDGMWCPEMDVKNWPCNGCAQMARPYLVDINVEQCELLRIEQVNL